MRDLLIREAVLPHMEGDAKKQILQDLSAHAASLLGLEPLSVFDVLWEREKLGTTGVGAGIAIPHGRVPGLADVGAVFARLAQPVAFDSVDDQPVDLVFMLLAPAEAGADHLHALAAISRLLRNTELCAALRAAKGRDEIYRLLTETEIAAAA